eukprot:scaffold435_cov342-Pavlova_lutheri.AAC.34
MALSWHLATSRSLRFFLSFFRRCVHGLPSATGWAITVPFIVGFLKLLSNPTPAWTPRSAAPVAQRGGTDPPRPLPSRGIRSPRTPPGLRDGADATRWGSPPPPSREETPLGEGEGASSLFLPLERG